MIGTLMIAGLCLALGCILGYAYRPKPKRVDPLNQTGQRDYATFEREMLGTFPERAPQVEGPPPPIPTNEWHGLVADDTS